MIDTSLFSSLKNIIFHFDTSLQSLSTMRLEARGNYCLVTSKEDLQELISVLRINNIKYDVLGWGANTLLPLRDLDKLWIKLQFPLGSELDSPKEFYHLPANTALSALVGHASKYGNKGWEALTGIPATLGGALYMNAGTKLGEISSLVKEVLLLTKEGTFRNEVITLNSYSYRKNHFVREGEIIVSAVLTQMGFDLEQVPLKISEYFEYRKKTQPLKSFNCGCIFKNPSNLSAGALIDELGLKGFEYKGLRVSTIHANFIENVGAANFDDFKELIKLIQETVYKAKGFYLELEIQNT